MEDTQPLAIHRLATEATASESATTYAIIRTPTVPVHKLSGGRMHLPGGHTVLPQVHRAAETTLAITSGYLAVLSGQHMKPILPSAGDMVYIPPTVPYALVNLSLNASVLALVFRTDPGFSSDLRRTPELDPAVTTQVEELRTNHLKQLMSRRTGRARRRRTT